MGYFEKPSMTLLKDKVVVKRKKKPVGVEVQYKEISFSGREEISYSTHKSWKEVGGYTVFYDDFLSEEIALVIPTDLIYSIKPTWEDKSNKGSEYKWI